MRGTVKKFIGVGVIILFMMLYGCTKDIEMTSIKIVESSIPEDILYVELNLSDILVEITYSDGHQDTIPLETYMLSDTDIAKLSNGGVHTIDVHFLGLSTSFTIRLTAPIVYELANGRYDFQNLSYLEKEYMVSKLEAYLMEHMYGGIPLVSQSKMMVFSDRVELPTNQYEYRHGYMLPYYALTDDDSLVKFSADAYGIAGQYTFRTYYTDEQDNLNPWINIPRTPTSVYDHLSGTLYERVSTPYDDPFTYSPSLADDFPLPIGGEMTQHGIQSNRWQISIKDQLSWYLPEGSTVNDSLITAEDFVWTYLLALKENWPLVSYGYYPLSESGIKNVRNYLDGQATLEDVGIKVTSDLTIELEYESPVTAYEILALFSTPFYAPIHQELYEILGDDYASSLETTPSSGLFRLSSWMYEDSISLVLNELHPNSEHTSLTGIHYRYFPDVDFLTDSQGIYQAYLAGELDMAYVPYDHLRDQIWDTPYIAETSTTVWRLGINSLGTPERRLEFSEKFPDLSLNMDYDLEAILMYDSMRKALYYGIDRMSLTDQYRLGYSPEYMLISSHYAMNPYVQSYRSGDLPSQIADAYYDENETFDASIAKAYFKEALASAITDGYYEVGTEGNYQVIELSLFYQSSGRQNVVQMMENLESLYEDVLVDDEYYVKVDIQLYDVAFPTCYMPNLTASAAYDLYFGGISGPTYDLAKDMWLYSDIDPNNFSLSIGIDTSSPVIDIMYEDDQGEVQYTLLSYNALLSALLGVTYISDGHIQTDFDDAEAAIHATLDMEGFTVSQILLKDNILMAYTGIEKDLYASILEVDHVYGYLITLSSGEKEFVIVTEDNLRYKVSEKISLYNSVFDTIEQYVKDLSPYMTLISLEPLLFDVDIQNNEYLIDYFDYTSLQDIANDYGVSLNHLRVYSVSWNMINSSWSDVFLIIEIDGIYLPLEWL